MELVLEQISKRYPNGKEALSGVSASFGPGAIGIVGPNGSGKTTLLRIIATTLAPTSGHVTFDGADVVRKPQTLRRELVYMPQHFGVYERLSGLEFLEYLARIRGTNPRAARANAAKSLERAGLAAEAKRKLGTYSPGMRQRVALAYVLQTPAAVVVLDEPTAGLDPESSAALSVALAARAKESIVFVCTHILSDLGIATRIVRMSDGRITG